MCVWHVPLSGSLQERNKKKADRMMADYDDDEDDYRYYKWVHGMIVECMSYAHGAQYMSYAHGAQYMSYAHGAQYFKPHKSPTSNTMCANPLFN